MIRRAIAFLALLAMGSIDAHAATRSYPSLAKRPAEAGDRLNEAASMLVAPAATDPALAEEVATLQSKAADGDDAFKAEFSKSRQSVDAATGAEPVSEAWIAAQMAISAADAARYESVAALAGLDTLHVDKQDSQDSARVATDLATIDPARTHVLAMVDAQNDALDSLRTMLSQP